MSPWHAAPLGAQLCPAREQLHCSKALYFPAIYVYLTSASAKMITHLLLRDADSQVSKEAQIAVGSLGLLSVLEAARWLQMVSRQSWGDVCL